LRVTGFGLETQLARNPREWAGSVNIPLNRLQERIAEIPRDRRIAVHCAGGYRSSVAASMLHRYGIAQLIEMAGVRAALGCTRQSLMPL
jgi:rhodanese-related sulfurtransferase